MAAVQEIKVKISADASELVDRLRRAADTLAGKPAHVSCANYQRLSPLGRQVVDQALLEALQRGHNYIGPNHLRFALDRLFPAE